MRKLQLDAQLLNLCFLFVIRFGPALNDFNQALDRQEMTITLRVVRASSAGFPAFAPVIMYVFKHLPRTLPCTPHNIRRGSPRRRLSLL